MLQRRVQRAGLTLRPQRSAQRRHMPLHKTFAVVVLTKVLTGIYQALMLCGLGRFHVETLPVPQQAPMLKREQ